MRKKLFLVRIIFIMLLLEGCNFQLISYNEKKTNNFFYTKELLTSMKEDSDFTVSLFQSNLHKELDITKDALPVLKGFMEDLNKDSFVDAPKDLPPTAPYRLFITFKNQKYIINVFNEDIVSIHPWDGVFKEDFITMKNIHRAYNLYGLCKYIFTIE